MKLCTNNWEQMDKESLLSIGSYNLIMPNNWRYGELLGPKERLMNKTKKEIGTNNIPNKALNHMPATEEWILIFMLKGFERSD